MRINGRIRASIGLGVLTIVAALVELLALTDIAHGEGDLTLEWNAVRVCFLVVLIAQIACVAALATVGRARTCGSA